MVGLADEASSLWTRYVRVVTSASTRTDAAFECATALDDGDRPNLKLVTIRPGFEPTAQSSNVTGCSVSTRSRRRNVSFGDYATHRCIGHLRMLFGSDDES